MVCDFHSHVLFGMDDGAKDVETSEAMLEASKNDDVTDILSTSHCYPYSSEDIEQFLKKREKPYSILSENKEFPKLHRACEVHLTGDITKFQNLKSLCIENTDYMLVEMPRSLWTDKTVDIVYKLILMGIKPIIAHDERNMQQRAELRNALYDLDVLIQINAPSLFMLSYRREIDKMLKLGLVHVIGTDMHNMSSRKPCMAKAEKTIKHRYGEECWAYFMNNAEKILNGEELSYREFKSFKKKSIF